MSLSKRAKKRQSSSGVTRRVPVTASRLRDGWAHPAGRVRLIRPGEERAASALMGLADVDLEPLLAQAIGDGSSSQALPVGLDHNRTEYLRAAVTACMREHLAEGLSSMSLVLVAATAADEVVGVLTGTPPLATLETAAEALGYTPVQLVGLSLAIAKIQVVAVAEPARGRGLAGEMLKRAWQVYSQLEFSLAYGQFDVGSGLESFYDVRGFTIHASGERLSLERINLPMAINADGGEQLFSRWRARG